MQTTEEGCQTILYCALQKGIENYSGEHFVDCTKVPPYKTVAVSALAREVWAATENIVGLNSKKQI